MDLADFGSLFFLHSMIFMAKLNLSVFRPTFAFIPFFTLHLAWVKCLFGSSWLLKFYFFELSSWEVFLLGLKFIERQQTDFFVLFHLL